MLAGLDKLDNDYGSARDNPRRAKSKVTEQKDEVVKLLQVLHRDYDRHNEILMHMDQYWASYYEVPEHESRIVMIDR